ncbi:MAG TPA: hypothetical protein VMV95_03295 [Bacillota bacterium]|nr:hypothetical protein [Bacillota bacterium]
MKKIILVFLLISLIIPTVLAINLEIEKQSTDEVLIAELNNRIVFDLEITNLGTSSNFEFFNLLGFLMSPEKVYIGKEKTEEVSLELVSLASIEERGFYTITYYIKADDASQTSETLTFKIVDLQDALLVGSEDMDPESESIEIFIKNRENFDFGNIDVNFSSSFFAIEKSFSLGPEETKTFSVQLNSEDFSELIAGFYTLTAKVNIEGKEADVEGVIEFVEKNILTTTKKDFGFLIVTKIIEKENTGNTIERSETVIKKNIISRLFASFNPDPDLVEREGTKVYYTWDREIRPGETLEIIVKTNWLFPFLIILFIILIVVLTKKYSETTLVLKKKVSFVKVKSGEFALKVSVLVNAKKYVERVNIIDRVPPLTEIYERFGGDQPSRIDKKNRRIEWSFEKLEAGEMRVLSYVIYSKVGVLGKFALPTATAIYEKEGEIHESESNRAFFVAEQRKKDLED